MSFDGFDLNAFFEPSGTGLLAFLEGMKDRLAAWRNLFELVEPDLLVCDIQSEAHPRSCCRGLTPRSGARV